MFTRPAVQHVAYYSLTPNASQAQQCLHCGNPILVLSITFPTCVCYVEKIRIAPIDKEADRTLTFKRRKVGTVKKAMELSILCNANVGLFVFGEDGKLYVYSSKPYQQFLNDFCAYDGKAMVLDNDDHGKLVSGELP